jgi:hypothetical protein
MLLRNEGTIDPEMNKANQMQKLYWNDS